MRTGDNIYRRKDGRFEARYIKERRPTGKAVYGSCYGRTYEEARDKREHILCQKYAEKHGPKGLNLLILGAGSHGQEVYDIAHSQNVYEKISFLDDNARIPGVIGSWKEAEMLHEEYVAAIVAVGDEHIRKIWTTKLTKFGFAIPTVVHPSAIVAINAEIGTGSVICARAIIGAGAKIGTGCIVSAGVTIDRGVEVDDWTHINVGGVITNHSSGD